MKVAVVGSREYANLESVRAFVRGLPPGTVLVSGGAIGVDSVAEETARGLGMECLIFLPNYDTFGKRAPLERNKQIAEACDVMHAFWDGQSHGTLNAVGHASNLGRQTTIHHGMRAEPKLTEAQAFGVALKSSR